ncbi:MAG: hypothetical protein ACRCUM_00280, partial [Mycoplasmoidaceae bacterium]
NQILDKPYRLFLHQELFPFSSNVFFNKPNSNSFMCEGVKPTIDGIWESYKKNPNASLGGYNMLESKEVLCGFDMNKDDVYESNSSESGNYALENWDTSSFFQMKGEYDFSSVPGIKNVKEWNGAKYSYAMFLNFNSYVNFSSDVFNFDYKETKKYKLTDTLGVIGGLTDILIGGLDIGWTDSNSKAPNQPMNLRIPCIAYLNGMSALEENAPLPCDVFLDDKAKQVIPVNTNVMTSHRFSLTNLIKDTSQPRPGAPIGKGGDCIWNTKYLGQTKFEDGTFINEDESEFEWNPPTTTTVDAGVGKKWIIDIIKPHVIANCDVRLTAYVEDDFAKPVSIYQSLFSTLSKSINDVRLWGSTMKFNYYDELNTEGDRVKWPEMVLPPLPEFDKSPIIFENINFAGEELEAKQLQFKKTGTVFSDEKSGNNIGYRHELSISSTSTKYVLNSNVIFEFKDFGYQATTIKQRKIDTMQDLAYVEINYEISFGEDIIPITLYCPINAISDDEGIVDNNSIVEQKPNVNLNGSKVSYQIIGIGNITQNGTIGYIKPLNF